MAGNEGTPATVTQNSAPVRKVSAGAFAGAVVIFIVAVLNSYVLPKDHPITADISSAATTIVTFLVGYMVSPSPNETTMQDTAGKVVSAVK